MTPSTSSRASSPAASVGAPDYVYPYAKGVELCIQRHVPPKPFGGDYGPSPRGEAVRPESEFIDRLDYVLANPPLDTVPSTGEEHCFTITGTIAWGGWGPASGGAYGECGA